MRKGRGRTETEISPSKATKANKLYQNTKHRSAEIASEECTLEYTRPQREDLRDMLRLTTEYTQPDIHYTCPIETTEHR